jgi:hypothetical protein
MKKYVLPNDWCQYFLVFQLVLKNYTGVGPSVASPATSHSAKVPIDVSLEVSSGGNPLNQEIAELWRQLQSIKKQNVIVMEQSRKSSDWERAALQQAQEALELKETTTANAAQSAQRENYMLVLMTDASHDMAGMLLLSYCFFFYLFYASPCASLLFSSFHRCLSRCCRWRIAGECASWNSSSPC